jgi:hypothetical protein
MLTVVKLLFGSLVAFVGSRAALAAATNSVSWNGRVPLACRSRVGTGLSGPSPFVVGAAGRTPWYWSSRRPSSPGTAARSASSGVESLWPAARRRVPRSGVSSGRWLRRTQPGALSGRTMARTGLRMMPTFPSSPLRFRTAGFPQYGSKAGLSDGPSCTAPTCRVVSLPPSFVHSVAARSLRSESKASARWCTAVRAAHATLPQGPSLRPSCIVSASSLNRPHPPHSQARRNFPAWQVICGAFAVPACRPRRPASGSGLSLTAPSWHVVL